MCIVHCGLCQEQFLFPVRRVAPSGELQAVFQMGKEIWLKVWNNEGIKVSSFSKYDKGNLLIMAGGDAKLILLKDAVKNEKNTVTVLILQVHINLTTINVLKLQCKYVSIKWNKVLMIRTDGLI